MPLIVNGANRVPLHESSPIKIQENSPIKGGFTGVFTNEAEQVIERPKCQVYLENGRYKNSFEEICFLGKGGFGVCHKVKHKLDSNFYAIKKVRLHLAFD